MTISKDAEKSFGEKKINIHSWFKNKQQKLGRERNFLNPKKIIYKNPAANVILSGEKLSAFP